MWLVTVSQSNDIPACGWSLFYLYCHCLVDFARFCVGCHCFLTVSAESGTVMAPVTLTFRKVGYFKFEASLCYIVNFKLA